MRVVLITNIPAPYRIPAWNMVGKRLGDNFLVLFCSRTEPNRKWNIPEITCNHIFLKERFTTKKDGTTFIHNNPDVWQRLKAFKAEVVITLGFNPTMLYAFIYALLYRKKYIPFSDSWEMSERHLSRIHQMLRKFIYRFSHAFIACSLKGKAYFNSYGLDESSIFISHLVAGNITQNGRKKFSERRYDIMFSGQFTERKNPLFFVAVAKLLQQAIPDLKVLLLGNGPLQVQTTHQLKEANIDYDFPGFASQEELPHFYANSKLFLFPTSFDAWGIVANEALSAGTPVITTPYAGCADELVLHQQNGWILPLQVQKWADHCLELLQDEKKWNGFSENAVQISAKFTHEKAAQALIDACRYAVNK